MDERERAVERNISVLEAKNQEMDQKVSLAEKERALAEAKKAYGKDWKKVLFGALGHLKINRETLQTLHSMGSNEKLKDLNDPRQFGSARRREVFRE